MTEHIEELMFKCWTGGESADDIKTAISLILSHLKMEIVKTNAAKHGNIELLLRSIES